MELTVEEIEKIIDNEWRNVERSKRQIETERACIQGCRKAIKFWQVEFKRTRAARKGASRGSK